jgi:hypothetical protein
MKTFLKFLATYLLTIAPALAQIAPLGPNLFMASPLSGTGYLGARAIGAADIPASVLGAMALTSLQTNPTSVQDYFTTPPVQLFACGGTGALFSYATNGGHIAGDSQRASCIIHMTTLQGPTQQEGGLWVDVDNITGSVNNWVTGTVYNFHEYMWDAAQASIYQISDNPNCTSGVSSPTGASNQTNGTCHLIYLNPALNNGKEGAFTSFQQGNVGGTARGGNSWGNAIALTLFPNSFPRVKGGFATAIEVDVLDEAADCPIGGGTQGCNLFTEFINGIPSASMFQVAGLFFGGAAGGTWFAHDAILINPGYAKDVAINDTSGAGVGIQTTGNLGARNLFGNSTAPVLSTCGTSPSLSAGSNDLHGTVTVGTGSPAACTLTFSHTRANAADCSLTWHSWGYSLYSTSTSALSWTFAAQSGVAFTYQCMGQ